MRNFFIPGGSARAGFILHLLDAVRGGGVRADAAHQAAAQPHRVPPHVLARHVQLGHQPAHLRLEERRLQGRVREAPALQAARHLRVQGLPRAGAQTRLRRATRRLHHQDTHWIVDVGRQARAFGVRGEGNRYRQVSYY